jgi:hypothetical protein
MIFCWTAYKRIDYKKDGLKFISHESYHNIMISMLCCIAEDINQNEDDTSQITIYGQNMIKKIKKNHLNMA